MHYLLSAALIALVSLPLPAAEASDEVELRHLKQVLWPRAYRENDVELLDAILHSEFVMISPDGAPSSKAEELENLPSHDWPHDNFEFEIQRLDIYHGNTAIISGQGRASGTGEDGPYCFTYQSSNVLVSSEDGWKAVASHVSGVRSDC